MNKYEIITDVAMDLPQEILQKYDIKYIPMTFFLGGKEYTYSFNSNSEISIEEFYQKLKAGEKTHTSQISPIVFKEHFKSYLDKEKDILYVGLSSALSGTLNNAHLAAEELKKEYPERKILISDSLAACVGGALLVFLASQKRSEGYLIEEVYDWIEQNKLHINHNLVVEDMERLRKGGRMNAAEAYIAHIINIKLLISMDKEGKLYLSDKIRGVKNLEKKLFDKIKKHIMTDTCAYIIIGYTPERDDVEMIENYLKEKLDFKVQTIKTLIGPIIGLHTGEGAVGIAFYSDER